jgi:hypothetical protein
MRSDAICAMLAALAGLAVATPAGADSGPAGIEGCIVSGSMRSPTVEGLAVHLGRCRYTATRRAGYFATGAPWSVSVRRGTGHTAAVTTYTSSNGAHRLCDAVIAPGDEVTVTASGGALAMAGNPVPAAFDFLPTGTGKCAG